MGLMIHSLENIPSSARRDFFIYLLDYGWNEPISNSLRDNFDRMAQIAATNKAVIIKQPAYIAVLFTSIVLRNEKALPVYHYSNSFSVLRPVGQRTTSYCWR